MDAPSGVAVGLCAQTGQRSVSYFPSYVVMRSVSKEGMVGGCSFVRWPSVREVRDWRSVRRRAIDWCWGGAEGQRE